MVENKKIVSTKKLNILNFSAILFAILFYTGIIKTKEALYLKSLLKTEEIIFLKGKINSNPIKNEQKKIYRANFSPEFAQDSLGKTSECKGNIVLEIPENFVEAYFPGKLYTQAKTNALICEQNFKIEIFGNFKGTSKTFKVTHAFQGEKGTSLIDKIQYIRGICRIYFRRLMYAWGDSGGFFMALISGIKEYAKSELCTNFKNAGLSHVLALSGMHLSMFSSIFKKFGKKTKNNFLSSFLQIFAICTFVWFAGISPSLLRAMLCSLMLIFCSICNFKDVKMLNILSVPFLIHAIIKPCDLNEISFQLSYGALAGILIFSELFNFITVAKIPAKLSSDLGASCGAQVVTAPISIAKLNSFAPIGIISSVVISPFITFFIYAGLLLFVLCLIFPFLLPFATFIMQKIYIAIEKIVSFFANFPSF